MLQPHTKFETWTEAPGRRVELYMDHMVPDMFVRAKLGDGRNYRVRLEEWALPRLLFTQIEDADPYDADLNPLARRYRKLDVMMLRVVTQGSVTGVFGNRPASLRAGDVYLFDMDERALVKSPGCAYQTLYLPRSVLPDSPGFTYFAADTPVARLARSMVSGFAQALPTTSVPMADQLAEAGIRSLTALVGKDASAAFTGAEMTSMRAKAITDCIRSNLTGEGPTAAAVCRHFGLSRATLYRDMQTFGGFNAYVSSLRMDACFQELSKTPPSRGAVSSVAEKWGYTDPGHFSRAFKRHFGINPTEVMFEAPEPDKAGKRVSDTPHASTWARRLATLGSA